AGLDRDEGPGEGPLAPLRDGQRLRGRRAALPGRRAGAGVPAVGGLPAAQVRAAEQAAVGGGGGAGGAAACGGGGGVGERAGRRGWESCCGRGWGGWREPSAGRCGTGRPLSRTWRGTGRRDRLSSTTPAAAPWMRSAPGINARTCRRRWPR